MKTALTGRRCVFGCGWCLFIVAVVIVGGTETRAESDSAQEVAYEEARDDGLTQSEGTFSDTDGRSAYINNQFVDDSEQPELIDDMPPLYELLQKQMEQLLAESGPSDVAIYETPNAAGGGGSQTPGGSTLAVAPPAALPSFNGYASETDDPDAQDGDEEDAPSGNNQQTSYGNGPSMSSSSASETASTKKPSAATTPSPPPTTTTKAPEAQTTRRPAASQPSSIWVTRSPATARPPATSRPAAASRPVATSRPAAASRPAAVSRPAALSRPAPTTRPIPFKSPPPPPTNDQKRLITFRTVASSSQIFATPFGEMIFKYSIGMANTPRDVAGNTTTTNATFNLPAAAALNLLKKLSQSRVVADALKAASAKHGQTNGNKRKPKAQPLYNYII